MRSFTFLLLASLIPLPLSAQTLESIEQQWRDGKFQQVLPQLTAYWRRPDGKSWPVEYMIGTSECYLDGLHDNGVAMLEDLLHSFQLPVVVRNAVEGEIKSCRDRTTSTGARPSFELAPVVLQVVPATVSGKGGFIMPESSTPTSKVAVSAIPSSDLQKRLRVASEAKLALTEGQNRMAFGARGAIVDRFVVISSSSDPGSAKSIGKCLSHYERPLEKQFGMEPPSYLMTVYAVRNLDQMQEYSLQLHHVKMPLGTVAYSVYQDLSIVGMGGGDACGSFGHELVHLMIRRNFGNSPPWLEEGLASEVAVASPKFDTFEFARSWRDEMLDREWSFRPTVSELLSLDWTSFSAASTSDLERVAAVHAMAAVFTRYLFEKEKLTGVFFAMRDNRFDVTLRD